MKTKFLSLDTGINEWRRLTGHEGHINEDVLRANLSDAVSQIITDEQFGYKIALITLSSRKTKLPLDYEILCVAAAFTGGEPLLNRGKMVNWVYEAGDCELEINLKCPDCPTPECTCSRPVIVEVDKLFREDHPEFQVNKWRHFAGVSRPNTDGFPFLKGQPQFRLLTPFYGQDALWNIKHYVGDCPNLGLPSCPGYQFQIENGHLITDFDKGQILLSYLGTYRDKDGYYLIPDTPEAIAACVWYAQSRELYRRYLASFDAAIERAYYAAQAQADLHIGRARDELGIPAAEDWATFFRKVWYTPDHVHSYVNYYNR